MIRGIDHIGIAVRSIEEKLPFYRDVLDLGEVEVEEVPEQKVRVAVIMTPQGRIELLEPTSEDSTVAKYLEKRGEGMHHVALSVDDIDAEIARLKSQDTRMIDETPRIGAGGVRIAFIHPKSAGGVLTELCERAS
ncbi:MAG: methylmalonyl-CoA epimerase [bacterium]